MTLQRGGRGSSAARLMGLVRFLETMARPHGIDELAARFDVTPRTIRRDLAVLVSVGCVVQKASGDNGRNRGVGGQPMRVVRFAWRPE